MQSVQVGSGTLYLCYIFTLGLRRQKRSYHHKLPNLKLLLWLEFVLVQLPWSSGCVSRVISSIHSEFSSVVVVVIVFGYEGS